MGFAEDEKVKQQLLSAGIKSSRGMNAYAASRFIGPVIGIACGSLIRTNTVFWALSLGAVFYLVPDMWLKMKIKKRRERIRKSLPDALDLLVICVEAGLGLDQAMLRVGQELIISHPDIHQEFMQVNLEQLAGKPRLEAWKSAAERTQIPEFSLFVSMLTQADRFGTPIVRALSRFGDEIRHEKTAAGRGDGGEDKNQNTLSSCPVHFSLHFHCVACARGSEHCQEYAGVQVGRCSSIFR